MPLSSTETIICHYHAQHRQFEGDPNLRLEKISSSKIARELVRGASKMALGVIILPLPNVMHVDVS